MSGRAVQSPGQPNLPPVSLVNLSHTTPRPQGFSLVEMLVVIAIVGILAAIAVPSVSTVNEGSRRGVAQNVVETLNKATREYSHSHYDLRSAHLPASADDEMQLLRTLQWRDPNPSGELNVSGPFMRIDWNPSPSNDAKDYRAEWLGSSWRLLEPGMSGAGLKIVFDGSDLGNPYHHDAGFVPFGSR